MANKFVSLFSNLGGTVRKNSPLILTIGTCLGVGGVIFTTIKATRKYDSRVEPDLPKKEKAKQAVKSYWPVAVIAGGTVVMTVCNHKINSEKIHTATVAYEFYKEAYTSYKDKVREKLGETTDREIQSDIAKDKIDISEVDTATNLGYGNVLFIESVTGQMFRTSVDYIRKCEKQFNQYELKGSDWAPFNNWLIMLGIRPMDSAVGDYLGFREKYEHDGLNITLTPSSELIGTGETATLLTYDDELCTEGDYKTIDW